MKYIRFKDIPPNERSSVHDGDLGVVAREEGVSCYECIEHEGVFKIVVPSLCNGVLFDLSGFLYRLEKGETPCYLVEGRQVGVGNYGEPVIRNVKIIHKLKLVELAKPAPVVKMDPTNVQLIVQD